MICRQRRTHLKAGQPPAIQPAPRRRRKPPNHWVMPWILQRQETGCYRKLLANLIHTDIPEYQNFVRTPLAFLPHRRMHTPPHQEVSHQFLEAISSWTETGNNADTWQQKRPTPPCGITSWLVAPPSVNSSPRSAEPSLLNSRTKICTALLILMSGKGWRRSSEPEGMFTLLRASGGNRT